MYSLDERACILLNSIKGLSVRKINKILEQIDSPNILIQELTNYESLIIEFTSQEVYNEIVKARETLDNYIDKMNEQGVRAVTVCSEEYPRLLMEIIPIPVVIFCKGDISLLKTNTIAVVGTRECTRYGRETAEKFVSDLVKADFTIVSGLARGIDGVAHETALNLNGKTIAVVANGLDIIYPPEHKDLFNKIVDRGLIVSEYGLGTAPNAYQFPERNRIISGLSSGVLVVEAGEKSGALITLDYANDQGRDVFIVPGNINSRASKGSNERLKHMQCAIVTDANDILSEYHIAPTNNTTVSDIQLDFLEEKVLLELEKGEMHFDELLQISELDVGELNALLMRMQVCGIIKKTYGNFYGI